MIISIKKTLRYQHFFPLLKCGFFRFFIKVQYALVFLIYPSYSKFTNGKFHCIMFLDYCQLLELSVKAIRTKNYPTALIFARSMHKQKSHFL